MSYCEIIPFVAGKPDGGEEFRNAWGGAARIWESLYARYLKDPGKEYDCWINDKTGRLWKLAHNAEVPFSARAVLVSTFDWAIVRRENFSRFVRDLREFDEQFPAPDGTVNHLPGWASHIESLERDESVEAIGFLGTSVGESLFQEWDEEADAPIIYDLNERSEHFEVYERLEYEAVKQGES